MENYLSGSSLKGISLHSSDLDKEDIKFYIEFLGKYFVAIPNNLEAVQLIENWYKEYFNNRKKEILNEVLTIIENKNNFILIDDKIEAYKQFCERTNSLPIKSKNLLIERFNKAWEREKNIFLEKSLEIEPETLIQKEIDYTQKEIETINGRYLGIYPPNTKRIVALPLGDNIITSDDKTHIKSYLNVLKERVEELSNGKKEITTPTKEEKTTFKEKFVYLKELGFFDLKSFKDSTPTKKENS